MTEFTYTGNGQFYLRGGDEVLEAGDSAEFPDGVPDAFERDFKEAGEAAESESSEEEDSSPSEGEETDESGSEEDELPLDPTGLNIEPLNAELDAGDFTNDELSAMKEAEENDEARVGAIEAIEDAME